MDGRYEDPEDPSRRKYQRRHYRTPKNAWERQQRFLKQDPNSIALQPQTTYHNSFLEVEDVALYSEPRALRPVLDENWMAKANAAALRSLLPTDLDLLQAKKSIDKATYVSSYKHSFDHTLDDFKHRDVADAFFTSKAPPFRKTKASIIRNASANHDPPDISKKLSCPDALATTYGMEFESPSLYADQMRKGVWPEENSRKGRHPKEKECKSTSMHSLPPFPTTTVAHPKYITTYVAEYGRDDCMKVAVRQQHPQLPNIQRCNPKFPELVKELWVKSN